MSENNQKLDIKINSRNTGNQRQFIKNARHASLEGFTVFVAVASDSEAVSLRNKIGYDSAHDLAMVIPKNQA